MKSFICIPGFRYYRSGCSGDYLSYHSVEFGALVALRSSASSLRLTSAELPEVFRCLWNDFGVELHFDTPEGLA
jgi:hypothetical protein